MKDLFDEIMENDGFKHMNDEDKKEVKPNKIKELLDGEEDEDEISLDSNEPIW